MKVFFNGVSSYNELQDTIAKHKKDICNNLKINSFKWDSFWRNNEGYGINITPID